MSSFKTRLNQAAGRDGRIILACDYAAGAEAGAVEDIGLLSDHICGIKLNLHLLLPLGAGDVAKITRKAHDCGLECIADIKLNDIGNTNRAALQALWGMGFDAVIANPIMGAESLKDVTDLSHDCGCGVISLCHMSAPQAAGMYEMDVRHDGRLVPLYRAFLDVAASCRVDGIVVGATFPWIIRTCKESHPNLPVFSPGVGVQGGSAGDAVSAGSDYLIVGRSILESDDPVRTAAELRAQSL